MPFLKGYPLLVYGFLIYFNLVFFCFCANSFISLAFSKTAGVISAAKETSQFPDGILFLKHMDLCDGLCSS